MNQQVLWQLRSNLDQFQTVTAKIETLEIAGKVKESFKRAGLFLLMAIVSVLVPVFHFVLVPLFLLLSLMFFVLTFKMDRKLGTSLELPCLKCGKSVVVKAQAFRFPLQIRCSSCGEGHQLKEN